MYNIEKKFITHINMTRTGFGNGVHMNEIVLVKQEVALVRLVTGPAGSKKQSKESQVQQKRHGFRLILLTCSIKNPKTNRRLPVSLVLNNNLNELTMHYNTLCFNRNRCLPPDENKETRQSLSTGMFLFSAFKDNYSFSFHCAQRAMHLNLAKCDGMLLKDQCETPQLKEIDKGNS